MPNDPKLNLSPATAAGLAVILNAESNIACVRTAMSLLAVHSDHQVRAIHGLLADAFEEWAATRAKQAETMIENTGVDTVEFSLSSFEGDEATIGSHQQATLSLPYDSGVRGPHVLLARRDSGWVAGAAVPGWFDDRDPAIEGFKWQLNGEPVAARDECPVAPGDIIQVGRTRIVLR